MLVLKRKSGDWTDLTHNKSGDPVRIRITVRGNGAYVDVAFEDDARNFNIQRPERKPRPDPNAPLVTP